VRHAPICMRRVRAIGLLDDASLSLELYDSCDWRRDRSPCVCWGGCNSAITSGKESIKVEHLPAYRKALLHVDVVHIDAVRGAEAVGCGVATVS